MDAIKAFFRTAGTAVRTNIEGVLKTYPYTAAAIFIAGIGVSELAGWLLK